MPEKAMAPHSSTLAWKIPWMEEPGGLQSIGSLRVGHDWVTSLSLFTFMHWRRTRQPSPVFLPGESQGRGSLLGCRSMESHRVGHDWSDLAAVAAAVSNAIILQSPLTFLLNFWNALTRKSGRTPLAIWVKNTQISDLGQHAPPSSSVPQVLATLQSDTTETLRSVSIKHHRLVLQLE